MGEAAFSPTRTSVALRSIENGSSTRERPKTMLTPDLKRKKVETSAASLAVVAYPKSVPIPSKRVIKALYEMSLDECSEEASEVISDNNKHYNDQQRLTPAGILSFGNILLPAIGLEEENALRRVQSKFQRDTPEYKFLMENCRRLVRDSIRSAMYAVQSSQIIRYQQQEERKHQQLLRTKREREFLQMSRKEELERLAKEHTRKKEESRAEKKRYLAREHRRNQELWKEIVFLTSSVAQLEREERMWNQIEQDVKHLKGKQILLKKDNATSDLEQRCDESTSSRSSSRFIIIKPPKNPLQNKTEEMIKNMFYASTRIQKGLDMILEVLSESELSRKELHGKYKKDHVFRGYQSVHNPKSMIRFLSQSQD